jgi:hypothetical protein
LRWNRANQREKSANKRFKAGLSIRPEEIPLLHPDLRPFAILNLPPEASFSDIKQRRRELAREIQLTGGPDEMDQLRLISQAADEAVAIRIQSSTPVWQ